jgi:hypothetical protein
VKKLRPFWFTKLLFILLIIPAFLSGDDFTDAKLIKTGKYYFEKFNSGERTGQSGVRNDLVFRVFIPKSGKYTLRIKVPLTHPLNPAGIFDYKKASILIESIYILKSLSSSPVKITPSLKYDRPYLYTGSVIYTITASKLGTGLYFFKMSATTAGEYKPLPVYISVTESKRAIAEVISLFVEYVSLLKKANKVLVKLERGESLGQGKLSVIHEIIKKITLLKIKLSGLSDRDKQYFKKRLLINPEQKIFAKQVQRLGLNS